MKKYEMEANASQATNHNKERLRLVLQLTQLIDALRIRRLTSRSGCRGELERSSTRRTCNFL